MARKRSSKKQKSIRQLRRRIVQAIEYQISGDVYFLSGYLMFAVLWSVLGWPLFWAKITANCFGWTVNYLLQRYWAFGSDIVRSQQVHVTRRYALIMLIDFFLDYLIVAGLRLLGISPYIGQFISAGFFTFWNYAWYRLWVFPSKSGKAARGRA